MSPTPRTLVAFYSRTGTTERVARAVEARLDDPTVERLRPTKQRRYLHWLARSFVPGSTVAIDPVEADPRAFDAVFLGTPKWTFSCPPVTAYLDRVRFDGVPVGLFLTYGGFDEERYARRLEDRLRAAGAAEVVTLLARRERVDAGAVGADVEALVADVLELT